MFVKFIERLHSLHDQYLLNLLEQKKAFTCKKRFQLLQDVCYTNTKAVSFYRNTKMAAVKNRSIQMKPF